jgi:hypothetical protein
MALSFRLEARVADAQDCLGNWNLLQDLKELFCTNCIRQIHDDIKQFRQKGSVDTEIPPNEDQLIKNVITMTDLEIMKVERITSINQIFDIKADIHDANAKLNEYWKLVIERREVKRQKSIIRAIEYNKQAEIHARESAAKLLQSFLKKRIEKIKSEASPSSLKENENTNNHINDRMLLVKHKLLVLSGKGGVGKSTCAAQLAYTIAQQGYQVGLLDIDICGPSIPHMLGLIGHEVHQSASGWSPVYVDDNLGVMSIGFMLPSNDDAIIWRGPRKNGNNILIY